MRVSSITLSAPRGYRVTPGEMPVVSPPLSLGLRDFEPAGPTASGPCSFGEPHAATLSSVSRLARSFCLSVSGAVAPSASGRESRCLPRGSAAQCWRGRGESSARPSADPLSQQSEQVVEARLSPETDGRSQGCWPVNHPKLNCKDDQPGPGHEPQASRRSSPLCRSLAAGLHTGHGHSHTLSA